MSRALGFGCGILGVILFVASDVPLWGWGLYLMIVGILLMGETRK